MAGLKKPSLLSNHSSNSPYKSLYVNPLNDLGSAASGANKENMAPKMTSSKAKKPNSPVFKASNTKLALRPSSLQLCMKLDDPESLLGAPRLISSSSEAWDFSDSEAAPASSWSTLPNRSLLCRPLPLDVGRCTCIIVKEISEGMSVYSLYTNEGQGRQDRKLAVARHRRRNGRSEFILAQNPKGVCCSSDESFLGRVTANLMGSKYQIWDQGKPLDSMNNKRKRLLAVVAFVPTITTLTGNFRSMRAWIPKQQSMQLKNTNASQIQHTNGLPKDWEEKRNRSHQLFSKIPYYNKVSKRYELDFRERAGRPMPRIQTSVKNFQLTMEEKGRQTILQLGKIGKSKYLMDYRYPLTGYQAFCICLSSIDSKLCCSV
ncbi:hypothetical protein J5N97_002608 [Dioscorea zingiberensis]|uniref:Tubby C-terminal domain-containing protein n=1 Tax=Dioscorea zingiberensis TaxID=325984 RepID=A0A9D5D4L6_9LILI|nr:hypothetical protein J5N97_002608 [Dioscorea zingiberensis]